MDKGDRIAFPTEDTKLKYQAQPVNANDGFTDRSRPRSRRGMAAERACKRIRQSRRAKRPDNAIGTLHGLPFSADGRSSERFNPFDESALGARGRPVVLVDVAVRPAMDGLSMKLLRLLLLCDPRQKRRTTDMQ